MSYEILTFHADSPSQPLHVEGDLHGPARLNILLRSARRCDASVALTVLTTPGTNLLGTIVDFKRIDRAMGHDCPMLEPIRAQAAYVTTTLDERPMALLDSAVIVNTDLAALFQWDFDIGLTWRPSKRGPLFEGGVLLVNNKRPQASKQFFQRLLTAYADDIFDKRPRHGDALALAKIAGVDARQIKTGATEIGGVKYAFLPCARYNHSPDWRARSLLLERVDGKVLNFKGSSSRLMEPFWRYRIAEPASRGFAGLQDLASETCRLALQSRVYREAWERNSRRASERQRPTIAVALSRRLSWSYRAAPK